MCVIVSIHLINNERVMTTLFEHIKMVASAPDEIIFKQITQDKESILPLLMTEVEQFANQPDSILIHGDGYIRHIVSLFLLAHFRYQPAYPVIIKLISIPGDKVVNLTGEVFTEALGRILGSVYNGNLTPIKEVIENPRLSPWVRTAALDSLMVLWKEDVLTREEIVDYLKELMERKLEKKSGYVWDAIALIAFDLHPGDLQNLLRQAIKKKLIEPMVLNEQSLAACVKDDLTAVIKNKQNIVEGYIKEPFKELSWWLFPNVEDMDKGIDYAAMSVPIVDKKIIAGERAAPMGWRNETVVHTAVKIGRNEPCFCGSGKKYKKCCGG